MREMGLELGTVYSAYYMDAGKPVGWDLGVGT